MTNDDILQKIKYYMVCNLSFSIIKFWEKVIAQGFLAFDRNLYIERSTDCGSNFLEYNTFPFLIFFQFCFHKKKSI